MNAITASKSCKTCAYHLQTHKNISLCTRYIALDSATLKPTYLDTTFVRFPDFDLCMPEGREWKPIKSMYNDHNQNFDNN